MSNSLAGDLEGGGGSGVPSGDSSLCQKRKTSDRCKKNTNKNKDGETVHHSPSGATRISVCLTCLDSFRSTLVYVQPVPLSYSFACLDYEPSIFESLIDATKSYWLYLA